MRARRDARSGALCLAEPGREIVERTIKTAPGSVPGSRAALAVAFVTAMGWRLEQRREQWFTVTGLLVTLTRRPPPRSGWGSCRWRSSAKALAGRYDMSSCDLGRVRKQ